jgi:hypothetical protein
MAAALWNPPASVHRAADPDLDLAGSTAPNAYVASMTKAGAGLVC